MSQHIVINYKQQLISVISWLTTNKAGYVIYVYF